MQSLFFSPKGGGILNVNRMLSHSIAIVGYDRDFLAKSHSETKWMAIEGKWVEPVTQITMTVKEITCFKALSLRDTCRLNTR